MNKEQIKLKIQRLVNHYNVGNYSYVINKDKSISINDKNELISDTNNDSLFGLDLFWTNHEVFYTQVLVPFCVD